MECEGNEVSPLLANDTFSKNLQSFQLIPHKQIDLVCRTCLTNDSSFQSIFEMNLNEMIMKFTLVKILKEDKLPSRICSNCIVQIKQAYTFKKQAEKCDFVLKQHYSLHKETASANNSITKSSKKNLKQTKHKLSKDDCNLISECSENECEEPIQKSLEDNCNFVEIIKHEIKEELDVVDPLFIEEDQYSNEPTDPLECFPSNADSSSERSSNDDFTNTQQLPQYQTDTSTENSVVCTRNKKMKCIKARNHVCSICGKKWINLSHLKVHMRIHTGEKPYKCEVSNCSKSFTTKCNLNAHKNFHTGNNKMKDANGRKHVCSICGKKWFSPSYLKIHMRIHTGEKPYKCGISNCSKSFKSISNLNVHKLLHKGIHKKQHIGPKTHVCSICGKKWSNAAYLKVHMRIHTGERPYKCEFANCGKSFTTKCNLNTHENSHTGYNKMNDASTRKHVCSICGKKLISPSYLKIHMRFHTGEKPYKCDIPNCSKRFMSVSHLNEHKKIHKGNDKLKDANAKSYMCSICEKKWIRPSGLKLHMRTHTGERPYKCEVSNCGKSFRSVSNLNGHKKLHAGNKKTKDTKARNHICSVCGKKWTNPSGLKIHMRIHTGERPYKCEIFNCSKSFTTISNLNTHKKLHRGKTH